MTRLRTRPRRSPLVAIGIGILLIGGALAGATAYTSSRTAQTQEELAQTLKAQLEASGYARVTKSDYQRGLTSSTQTLNVSLGKADDPETLALIVTNRIQHGPFPGFKAVGNALIDTDVRFADADVQKKIDAALGGQKPTIRTVVGLDGGTSTHLDVPKGQYSEAGAVISWQPLIGDVLNSGLSSSSKINWPEFKMTSDAGNLTMADLSLSSNLSKQNAQDLLGVGDQTFTIKSLSYGDAGTSSKNSLQLSGLKVGSQGKLSDGFYNAALLYDIGQVAFKSPQTGALDFKKVQLHLSMNHLSREPLARLAQTLTTLSEQAKTAPGTTPNLSDTQQKALMDDGVALIKDQPVFSIDRLSLTQPSGEVVLSGKAEAPGAAAMTSEQLQLLSGSPFLALGMVKLSAQLKAPEAALRDLVGTISPGAAGNLDALVQAGYLKREGQNLVSDLAFSGGKGTVNGQALGGGF
ncbi:YdgA family protein [Deinococcus sp.]|uniref:YdgA family protein n=1 Tax=Deinococcus sp. TaxID=47478 RepID=UPI003B5CD6FF